jgi:FG-GAP-like repeat
VPCKAFVHRVKMAAAANESAERGRRRGGLLAAAVLALCAALASVALAASTNFVERASSPEAAGIFPRLVAAADFDGDSDPDLAVANEVSDDVTILRNNGAGNFTQPASSPEAVGDVPTSVAAADLDGDTDQDLAVANDGGSNNVTILLNNGLGDFTEPASSPEPAGSSARSVAVADFDGDLDADLAVANSGDSDVTILLNTGAGDFTEPASSPEEAGGFGPVSVAAADLDGDSDPDLAVANHGSDEVNILRNDGSGDFGQPASSPDAAGDGPFSVAAADLDGDGDQDLAVANQNSDDVTILRNRGSGNFTEPNSSPELAGDAPQSVAVADFDGDSDADLAVANQTSDDVTILRGNGAGNFGQPASSPELAGDGAQSVTAADFDGDLDADLAVANLFSGDVTILRNR